MKYIMLTILMLQCFAGFAQQDLHPIDIKYINCIEQAVPTTIGSINCEKEALKAWEAEMDTVLQLLKVNHELLDVGLLEETQDKWLAFHKKQIQFYYSYYQIQYQGGTMARVAALSYEKRHLRERVLFLQELYEEISEE